MGWDELVNEDDVLPAPVDAAVPAPPEPKPASHCPAGAPLAVDTTRLSAPLLANNSGGHVRLDRGMSTPSADPGERLGAGPVCEAARVRGIWLETTLPSTAVLDHVDPILMLLRDEVLEGMRLEE